MVDPICPHCQNTGFEIYREAVVGATQKLPMARCSACGAPISLFPSAELLPEASRCEAQLQALTRLVEDMLRRLTDIETRLAALSPPPAR
jgi:hypothetical protein